MEEVVDHVLDKWNPDETLCSWKLNRAIGEYLGKQAQGRGILKSCVEKNVPVFVPAFTDSELGIDLALNNRHRKLQGKPLLKFDPYLDFEHYASTMLATDRMGIFTIGGGVPRNWAQQFGVYAELLARRGYEKIPLKRYNYGLRICPEPVNWAACPGAPTPKLFHGASSSLKRKAEGSPKCSTTLQSRSR